MAKLHLEGGVTFEGTPEEIKAYTDLYAEGGAEKAQEKPEPAQSFKEGDVVVITGNTKMRHATQAEREQYEESLKPKKPKLKAGDWVEFAENFDDVTAGKKYEVVVDEDDGELCIIDDGGDKNVAIDNEPYEIVEPPSVFERIGRKEGEFKVGDVVRVIGDDVLGGENKDGDIGVVTSFGRWTGCPQVRVSGRDCGNDGNGWSAPAHYFELIAPVESRVDAN